MDSNLSNFGNAANPVAVSGDGSYTAFSTRFNEHYHSTRDGALNESLQKHIVPALTHCTGRAEVTILDICYGLGFNTLGTLWYLRRHHCTTKVRIFSPEMDGDLIRSLRNFPYPEAFATLAPVIDAVSRRGCYRDEQIQIQLYIGDARDYLKQCRERFDIVYQDAFSPSTNPLLWTGEYFSDMAKVIKREGILTTYSTALKTRLALYENGFNVYLNKGEGFRNATVASKMELEGFEKVDMEHKRGCNPDVKPLRDGQFLDGFSSKES